ncbi:sulfatase family protein [Portibacter marinus]|uniref:sulfatase family protein n=1 Tax=Portibacter marinus TaxID=2898660 RepID=UPI001F38F18B|nr:sulfatase [Portibacter marinus]
MKVYPFLLLIVLLISCKKETSEQPNIVIILADDLGFGDLACYGSEKNSTPHLDQMAAEGVKFTSYYAAQAVCSASRAALLTGCYPNRIGIHNALMPNSTIGLSTSETTIAEMLKGLGYQTAIYGKWHLGDHPNFLPTNHGFDEYVGIPYSNDMWPLHPQQGPVFNFGPLPLIKNETIIDTITDQTNLTVDLTHYATDFIKQNNDRPFFLYLAHPQPHVPLYVSDQFKGKSDNGLYGDVIMEIDWSVGEILKTLREENLDQNTLVIFTSDNGPWLAYGNHAGSAGYFREGKGTAWEGGQREPFIAWYPGTLPAKSSISTPLYAIDIMPTIAEITGGQLPYNKIDGKNTWEIWKGEKNESPHEAFYYYYKTNELHAIRYGDWKMVFPHRYRTMFGQKPGRDGLPGNYAQVDLEKPELYHLKRDPEEKENVYRDHLNIVAEMEKLAEQARLELGDQLTGREGKNVREPGRVSD